MTTNFALSLSFEGIELLHRVPRGWKRVGRADVEDPNLDQILADLRDKALALEPTGLRTKIIIPLDQIKYIAIDSTQTDMDDIHGALDGTTPYALDELVIDYEKFGGRTHIAAVARETLIEAEAFARAHRFRPVSFVAVPEPFTFQKEVFFGPTAMMQEVLGPDGHVERDALPVMVVGTRIKSRLLVFDIPEEELPPTDDIDLAALLAPQAEPEASDVETPATETPPAEVEAAPAPQAPQPVATWVDRTPPEVRLPEPVSAALEAAQPELPLVVAEPELTAAPTLLDRVVPEYHPPTIPAPINTVAVMSATEPVRPAHFDRVIPEYAATSPAPAPRQAQTKKPALTAKDPAVPKSLPTIGAAPVARANPFAAPPSPKSRKPLYIGTGIAASIALAGVFAWMQMRAPADVVAVVDAPAPVASAPPVVEIAAAPSLHTEDPTGLTVLDPETGAVPQMSPETIVATSTAPEQLVATAADTLPSAVQAAPPPPAPETAQASVGAPILRGRVLTPDEAAQIYSITGVWQRAARAAPVPRTTSTDGLIQPEALPVPARLTQPEVPPLDNLETDLSFITPADPPAPDVDFALDENGFILATPEGAPTPEGALVFAGLPDFEVRVRPELSEADLARMALLAPAPEGVVIIAGSPSVQPPLRPDYASLPTDTASVETSDENAETAPTPGGVTLSALQGDTPAADTEQLDNPSAAEVAALRPTARPAAAASTVPSNPDITSIIAGITAEETENPSAIDPSEGTVSASLRPELRPRNFATVVAAARERQATQQASAAAAPVRTAAPVAPQNYAPVPGGVARAATQEDVIPLRDMNLIGVYGRPNARRALVRLPNGRYVRVEVGSALDGGQVTAIGDAALNYVKRGRTYALELPSG